MSSGRRTWRASRARCATALQALGILVVYFGVVVALMYPVAYAAGFLT